MRLILPLSCESSVGNQVGNAVTVGFDCDCSPSLPHHMESMTSTGRKQGEEAAGHGIQVKDEQQSVSYVKPLVSNRA